MDLLKVYKILLKEYGSQNWWPVTASLSFKKKGYRTQRNDLQNKELKPEYSGGPKTDKQRLEVAFGAILTQNTSWKNVEKAIINLNINGLIDVEKIQKMKQEELEKIIKPSGFYRQKAERLKIFCDFISDKKFENITREELLSVRGIGPETADSILLYAFNKPEFVVDAYTKRIFNRLSFSFEKRKSYRTKKKTFTKIDWNNYDDVKEFFQNNLPKDPKIYQEFHALIVEHAKRFCRKMPECSGCHLLRGCKYKGRKI